MGEYFFGVGNGEVSNTEAKRCNRIARKHGADFTRVTLPGDGPRFWFSCPNQGHPFDGATARAVMDEVGEVKVKGAARIADEASYGMHALGEDD